MRAIFVQIKCEMGQAYKVAREAAVAIEQMSELYSTSGQYDLLGKFYLEPEQDIGQFVTEKIQTLPGVKDTYTLITFNAFSGGRGRPFGGLRPARDQVDLHQRAAGEARDTDAGARGQPVRRKVAAVHCIHRRIVLLEPGQVRPDTHPVPQPKAETAQHDDQVVHDPPRLSLDPPRQRREIVARRVGIWPVRNTKPPASTAWENGATGVGAPAIM